MKKTILLLVFICAAAFVYGQAYTVEEVTGRVQRESGNRRADIIRGEVLAADTVIYAIGGSSVVIRTGDRMYTVTGPRGGRISDLVSLSPGLRITGFITRVGVEGAAWADDRITFPLIGGLIEDVNIAAE